MNKCRYLHNIINDNNTRPNWCKVQFNFETKIKEYKLDKESKMLSSDNKSNFNK